MYVIYNTDHTPHTHTRTHARRGPRGDPRMAEIKGYRVLREPIRGAAAGAAEGAFSRMVFARKHKEKGPAEGGGAAGRTLFLSNVDDHGAPWRW